MATQSDRTRSRTKVRELRQAAPLAEEEHPDYIGGSLGETVAAETPRMAAPALRGTDVTPDVERAVLSSPDLVPPLLPMPQLPVRMIPRFCAAVSGRYRYVPSRPRAVPTPIAQPGSRPVRPRPTPIPVMPINLLNVTVRVDVDRFLPQNRISIQVSRLIPNSTAHAIAEVTSDVCSGFNQRTVRASIVYRDGDASLIAGDTVTFTARRTSGFHYSDFELELSGGGTAPRSYKLAYESRFFDAVEFEVDCVSNAGSIVTTYNTDSHPNHPTTLPSESISLATVYERAGFDVSMSPNTSVLPTSGAGSNGTWSDTEMHNAMVTYWSRFAGRPQWALWVLYAERHDSGRSLAGVMFDDIGQNHRQGTAIFTDSFIQDVPSGDPNPNAWRNRMQFWTAVHEMGHAFNLAHSWQKALGVPIAPGDPWIPLANEPEARSFMNYPFAVSGGEASFFADFRFRFSDDELVFMRHAPRRFVQMGNSAWFANHGFEKPDEFRHTGDWSLAIRPNRDVNAYRFLEPVTVELKLTNTSDQAAPMDAELLSDGRHLTVFVQRAGGGLKRWRPMMSHCHKARSEQLEPGESIYGAHMLSASTEGWLIDEPGFYKVQAAIDLGEEIVVSNVLRIQVGPAISAVETTLAPDYFTEDVARVITFGGAPTLSDANELLKKLCSDCRDNPAARHAEVALTAPKLRHFKILDADGGRERMAIKTARAEVGKASKAQIRALLDDPDAAADTLGHIPYFGQLRVVAEAMEDHGDDKGAVDIMSRTIDVMKQRGILGSIIDNSQRRLKRRTG